MRLGGACAGGRAGRGKSGKISMRSLSSPPCTSRTSAGLRGFGGLAAGRSTGAWLTRCGGGERRGSPAGMAAAERGRGTLPAGLGEDGTRPSGLRLFFRLIRGGVMIYCAAPESKRSLHARGAANLLHGDTRRASLAKEAHGTTWREVRWREEARGCPHGRRAQEGRRTQSRGRAEERRA